MRPFIKILIILCLALYNQFIYSFNEQDTIHVAFWNVENLFDTIDDPLKQDEEFLPTSEKEWTPERLEDKMFKLSRIILNMNNDRGPDVLGLCEVENENVLSEMVKKYLNNYNIAYRESPDNRGIDVGLIFKKNIFELVEINADTVHLPDRYPTRLILNVKLKLISNGEEFSFYINHWPSRRGGEETSERNRIAAGLTLRNFVDKNLKRNSREKIILMGDFNDEPNNKSITEALRAIPLYCDSLSNTSQNTIYNTSYKTKMDGIGSFKYREFWNLIDQVMVSSELVYGSGYVYDCGSFEVLKPELMVTKSGNFKGAPFPTYGGKRYLGGYSDHFPIEIRLIKK